MVCLLHDARRQMLGASLDTVHLALSTCISGSHSDFIARPGSVWAEIGVLVRQELDRVRQDQPTHEISSS